MESVFSRAELAGFAIYSSIRRMLYRAAGLTTLTQLSHL